jgi:iron complex outermembrane receptor protein
MLMYVSMFGNRDLDCEDITSYELGYRVKPVDRLSVDAAWFCHTSRDIIDNEVGAQYMDVDANGPHLVVPVNFVNKGRSEACGLELGATWQVLERWRLRPGYTWLNTDKEDHRGSDPHHRAYLNSYFDLSENVDLDVSLYYVSEFDSGGLNIPAYLRGDIRIAWRPTDDLEISLVGQNLFDDRHEEYSEDAAGTLGTAGGEVPRSVYLKITWRY